MHVLTLLRALAVASFVPSVLLVAFFLSQVEEDGKTREKVSLLHLNVSGSDSVAILNVSKSSSDSLLQEIAQSTLKVNVEKYAEPNLNNYHSIERIESEDITMAMSPGVINGIKKFVFFVGYPGSGHGIIGTLLDAHPRVVVLRRSGLLSHFSKLGKPFLPSLGEELYSVLYSKSKVWRKKFNGYIKVIGDRNGDVIMPSYLMDERKVLKHYEELKASLSIPIHIIHTVRNPFDLISAEVVRNLSRLHDTERFTPSGGASSVENSSRTGIVDRGIDDFFKKTDAAMRLIGILGKENMLDVHLCDLVDNPRGTLSEICNFLTVDTTELYLDTCAEKVYQSVSQSRKMVGWTAEQIEEVERRMKDYGVFDRYNFFGDTNSPQP